MSVTHTLTFIGNGTRVMFYERFFQGFCNAMKGLLALGFIDPNPNPLLHPKAADITWVSAYQSVTLRESDIFC